jgi:hypothetical protein
LNKVYIFFVIYSLAIPAGPWAQVPVPGADTAGGLTLRDTALFFVSPDSIEVPVHYGARDRVRFEYGDRVIHLYGDAYIRYQTMEIRAGYIRVELRNNIAVAEPASDSLGRRVEVPDFNDGRQTFKAQRIRYNFNTRKGYIDEIVTREGDLYVHGRQTKFISGQGSGTDDIIFNQHALLTTCDAEHPHYGIASKRQKIIPNKLAVIGPSYVQIQDIPTPLWLPFGFFPISKNARAGILFPREYTYDDRGFGLTNVGYYLPVSDNLDLKFLGDIFFKGSFRLAVNGNYKTRYKYNGNFSLQYENRIQELPNSYLTSVNRPISIRWSHNQESGAHPYHSFGGSVEIETGGFSKLQYGNYQTALQNVLRSNLTYNLQIPNSPFKLSASMFHSQNLISREVNLTLPELSLQMRSVNPFRRRNRAVQKERWYDRIATTYSAQIRNSVNTTDTLLFSEQVFDQLRYGFRHGLEVNSNFRVLKYLSITPVISYKEEISFFDQNIRLLDTVYTKPGDTTLIYGKLDTTLSRSITSFRTASASATMSTQLFGQILSSRGWFRGIRHQLTPSISFNYSPDYHQSPFSYFRTYETDLRPEKSETREYLRFANSPFGLPSVPGENFTLSFNLLNRVEMKYYRRQDSSFRKLPLIENFNLSAQYRVSADSFRLSPITGGGSNRFLNGILTVYYGFQLDPYGRKFVDGKEVRSKEFAIHENKKLVILNSGYLNFNAAATLGQLAGMFGAKSANKSAEGLPSLHELFYDFSLQYILNFRHSRSADGKDVFERTVHNIGLRGSLSLTRNWRINLNNISFNFDGGGVQYPTLGLERDLHCWVMRFDWSPQFGYYSFYLGVKPGSLEFIRIPSNQAFSGATR